MIYDLIIIGTGAAGYTAAIYAARYKLNTLLIGHSLGGMAATAHKIENWPGEISIAGADLLHKFESHTKHFRTPIKNEVVKKIIKIKLGFQVVTDYDQYQTKTLILALGTDRRKLNIIGEKEFLGKGVSYCATCDAFFYKNKTAVVVGGGNAATMAALQLGDIAKKVYLIHRDEEFKAEPFQLERISENKKIAVIKNNTATEIIGDNLVKAIKLEKPYQGVNEILADGIFIEAGAVPNSALVDDLKIDTNDRGFIKINSHQETNILGVFAAGDVTTGSAGFAQILTAAAEGAIAAFSTYQYFKKNKPN